MIDLESEFAKHGIDFSLIGFYDDPSFLRIEHNQPNFLENYAKFVNSRVYSNEYIERACIEVPFISQILHDEIVKDGRMGACVDVSIVLSRILEREGFWNYIVKGSLTIEFPEELGIANKYFWSVDMIEEGTTIAAAHAWIVAPPYRVIDLTVNQQPYKGGEGKHLPSFICCKEYALFKIAEIDLISPDASAFLASKGVKGNKLKHVKENFSDFIHSFKPCLVELNSVKFKYTTIAISAPDEPLERVKTLILRGKLGIEIYNEIVKPRLSELRGN